MNVVFIGMPGSGKTTIGKIVAEKLNKKFYDLDSIIETQEKMEIKDIFKNGEDYFRQLEYNCLKELSQYENAIISTGGGIVETEKAMEIIVKDYVIFLDRDIDDIIKNVDDESRPLLNGNKKQNLENLYIRRIDRYIKNADYTVKVTDLDNTVLNILDHLTKKGIAWKY